jgi:MoxR-like ATPase
VQFTPDLVPSDLIGTRIWRPDTAQFDTELGPVFGNFLLADEINRAPAKVQSALLEVMQERQVTIAGTTYPLPRPFLVMATQNPIESEGTYALPEAQIDRFLFKLVVTYPSLGDEAAVIGRAVGPPAQVQRGAQHARPRPPPQGRPGGLRRPRGHRLRRSAGRRDAPSRALRLEDLARWSATARARAARSASVQAGQALALLRGRSHVVARTCATSRPTSCATASR